VEVSFSTDFHRGGFLVYCTYSSVRYDSGYLMCSKKLTDSQLSLPHGTNKNVKEKKLKIS